MYCKNCGKEMNEYGICTNCGWRYSAVQTRQIPKRKNTLPIVYIIVGWTDNDFAFNLELGKRSKCRNNRA